LYNTGYPTSTSQQTINYVRVLERRVTQDNPFQGCGYSIAFDEKYNRLILGKIQVTKVTGVEGAEIVEPIVYYPYENKGLAQITDKDFLSKLEKGDVVVWQNELRTIL
jgi:hypothetical protein